MKPWFEDVEPVPGCFKATEVNFYHNGSQEASKILLLCLGSTDHKAIECLRTCTSACSAERQALVIFGNIQMR